MRILKCEHCLQFSLYELPLYIITMANLLLQQIINTVKQNF